MIKETTEADKEKLLSIIKASGQFDKSGLEYVQQTLEEHLTAPNRALWYTAHAGEPVGVAYCAPEPVTSGTWNLLMLWVENEHKGKGFGSSLITNIENEILKRGARLLIVETSGLADFQGARSFYKKTGFELEATIKNFFDINDDKLIYTKAIAKRE